MDLKSTYKDLLSKSVEINSISTDSTYKNQVEKMAKWCATELSEIGFEIEYIEGYGNPIVLASLEISPKFPTVIHYGHYDVQPASKDDGWDSDPFILTERNGKYFGRGSTDNKGQFIAYFAVIKRLKSLNNLGYNVKFILEGNEETGSPLLNKFINDYKPKLSADFALISDGEQVNGQPTVDISYRGTINAELTIFGPTNALHSGLYGGIINNPANLIVQILSEISKPSGKTPIFGQTRADITEQDEKNMKDNTFDFKGFTESTGVKNPLLDNSQEIYHTLGFTNVIELTGITSGYTGEGFRNAIPSSATAKINVRFEPGLQPEEVVNLLSDKIKSLAPSDTKYIFDVKDTSHGIKMESKNEYFLKVKNLLETTYQKPVFYNYCGATLPIAFELSKGLKIPTIFTGLANADCNMHGANENIDIETIEKGLEFLYKFLKSD